MSANPAIQAVDNTSGQALSPVPPEIDRWNWGAFLLNWIWGVGNNTFIALLMFVPVANLVMPFVLGAKGSAWAWRNKRWASIEHFKHVQRLWAIWGVVALVALVGFVVAVWFGVSALLKHSEPYQMALTQLQANTEAASLLGTPIKSGTPSGKIETSGPTGMADLEFSVEGPKGRGTVYLHASKQLGAWKLDRVELQVEGRRGRINLGEGGDRVKLENGLEAVKRGDYAAALQLLRPLAEQGYAEAQFNLAAMYGNGRGVPQDAAEAVKWYRLAAEQGHAVAQNNLGVAYSNGRGIAKDETEAVKWFQKSAEQGHVRAQYNLALMYDAGRGVAQNDAEAVKLYRKAAERGAADAQNNLAVMYARGRGVPQDMNEAARWYQKSAEQGYALGQHNIAFAYAEGRGVAQNYAEAAKWYRLAAAQKYARSQNNLGLLYMKGQGLPLDYVRAHMWFDLAAAGGVATGAKNRDEVAGKMTDEQIARAKALAEQCRQTSFKQCDELQATPEATGSGLH